MDIFDESKLDKVKLQDIYADIYEDCDSALADNFSIDVNRLADDKGYIDINNPEFQLYIRDFLELHENDYQYDLLKRALGRYYDSSYDIVDDDIEESYEVLEETDEYLDENATFEEIIYRMECAEIYEDLYNAAMLIVDPKLQNEVTKLIQQCEEDGDDVEEAYSIVTSDLLDMHINDKNVENLNEDKKIKTEKYEPDIGSSSYDLGIDFNSYLEENDNVCSLLDYVKFTLATMEADLGPSGLDSFEEVPDFDEILDDIKQDIGQGDITIDDWNKEEAEDYYNDWLDDLNLEESKKIKTEVKKTLNDVYSDSATESLWDEKFKELVPKEGKAETTIGEIMRCFASMSHAYLQNGEIIQNMQQYYLTKVKDLDEALKQLGDQVLINLLDKMDLTHSKSAYDHYMAEFYEYFVNTYLKDNKEVKTEAEENPQEFDYGLLSRLKSDCDYYLGCGNRNAEHCLWAKNEQGQIDKMREIYNKLKEKPEWLSEEDINNYAKEMGVVDLPSTTDGTAEKEIQDMVDRAEKRSEELDESRDSFNREELVAVKNSIDTALDDLQIQSDGTTGAMADKVLVNDLRDVSRSVGSYLNRVGESKKIKKEASKLPPDFKVDFEGDMTIDMGYTNEEGAEKRAEELLGDVAKSTNVRDLNVDVKDVKKIERENKTLTESEEKFSGVEFEKNIPHVMRYKQYDVSENENGKTLYWVTQQFFTLEELKQFQKAFISELANDKFGFTEAYVTVRDLSHYELDKDYEDGVLCYITKYDLDYEGYEEFCKEYNFDLNKGWLEESKELKKEDKIIWTSEYQGDEETAEQAYQEYIDEFEPSTKTPVSFEEWLEDTKDTWFDAEANRYKEENPDKDPDKLTDFELDEINAELYDRVEKEIEANMDDLKDQYEEYCEEIQKEMTSPEDKERWQTGWYEQDAEAQWEVMDEDFSDNIWPMIETQCNEDILILLGSVGRWNGTFDGGKIIYADEQNLRNTMSDYDEISVEADDENKLSINYMHHDGTDTMYLYTIPQDLTELAKAMEYDDPDELDTDIRQDYVDMEELAKHVDLLIPIINKGRGNV